MYYRICYSYWCNPAPVGTFFYLGKIYLRIYLGSDWVPAPCSEGISWCESSGKLTKYIHGIPVFHPRLPENDVKYFAISQMVLAFRRMSKTADAMCSTVIRMSLNSRLSYSKKVYIKIFKPRNRVRNVLNFSFRFRYLIL